MMYFIIIFMKLYCLMLTPRAMHLLLLADVVMYIFPLTNVYDERMTVVRK